MTTANASERWNSRYSGDEFAFGLAPNAFLASQRHLLKPGMVALVPADGEGRNGVWLAEQGLTVYAVDIAAVGLAKAQRLAQTRKVTIQTEQADLTTWRWPSARFDLIASIFFHLPPEQRPALHQAMWLALKPRGLLILEGYRPEQVTYRQRYGSVGGPPDGEWMFSLAELQREFSAGKALHLEAAEVELNEGRLHAGYSAVVRGVWQKAG